MHFLQCGGRRVDGGGWAWPWYSAEAWDGDKLLGDGENVFSMTGTSGIIIREYAMPPSRWKVGAEGIACMFTVQRQSTRTSAGEK